MRQVVCHIYGDFHMTLSSSVRYAVSHISLSRGIWACGNQYVTLVSRVVIPTLRLSKLRWIANILLKCYKHLMTPFDSIFKSKLNVHCWILQYACDALEKVELVKSSGPRENSYRRRLRPSMVKISVSWSSYFITNFYPLRDVNSLTDLCGLYRMMLWLLCTWAATVGTRILLPRE
jgi:hypothetical protein